MDRIFLIYYAAKLLQKITDPKQNDQKSYVGECKINEIPFLFFRIFFHHQFVRDQTRHGGNERAQAAEVTADNECLPV